MLYITYISIKLGGRGSVLKYHSYDTQINILFYIKIETVHIYTNILTLG